MEIKNCSVIKIPKHITCYICGDRNFLLIKGKIGSKLLKLDEKVSLSVKGNLIMLNYNFFFFKKYYTIRKEFLGLKSKIKTLIYKAIIDVSRRSFKKLKLVGVGFRVSCLEYEGLKLLKLDVGYSHSIYYRIPEDILITVTSPTRFIVSSNSIDRVGEVSSIIRKLKLPEPYKGKGIVYSDEEIQLKEIKKS